MLQQLNCLTGAVHSLFQAALGPAALDLISSGQTSGAAVADETSYATALLTVSVLSVVISAPMGAILIALTGPRLLSKIDGEKF